MSFFDLDSYDASAARFYGIPTDDLVHWPVGTFDKDVRLDRSDDLGGCVLGKQDNSIDASQRCENLRSLELVIDRPTQPLIASNRIISVQPDDQHVAELPCLVEIPDVSRMKQIEHTVGKDDLLPCDSEHLGVSYDVFSAQHPCARGNVLQERSPSIRVTLMLSENRHW
jgi:hypothetical protein